MVQAEGLSGGPCQLADRPESIQNGWWGMCHQVQGAWCLAHGGFPACAPREPNPILLGPEAGGFEITGVFHNMMEREPTITSLTNGVPQDVHWTASRTAKSQIESQWASRPGRLACLLGPQMLWQHLLAGMARSILTHPKLQNLNESEPLKFQNRLLNP